MASLEIPPSLRAIIGKGARFVESLETTDRKIADNRAAELGTRWRQQIEKARTARWAEGDGPAWWAARLGAVSPEKRPDIQELIRAEAEEIAREGADPYDDENPYPNREEAERYFQAATGQKLDGYIDDWKAAQWTEPKTVDMAVSTVTQFCKEFTFVKDVTRGKVQEWVDRRLKVVTGKTLRRHLSELRGYWAYLVSRQAAPDEPDPFARLTIPRQPARSKKEANYLPYKAADAIALVAKATAKGDVELADLIRLGMFTGARIEALCSLTLDRVTDEYLHMVKDKTPAGTRKVPVHSSLLPTIKRLREASKDGYLVSGLGRNKYDDRSNAIGKRFGRLKDGLGFGPRHAFHSFRSTVITFLENALVPENIVMDIVGHDKPTMTYGLYSGGFELSILKEAIEKVRYPGYIPA